MRMSKPNLCIFPLMAALCLAPAGAAATLYTDNFEASSINPFWTLSGPGSATLTGSAAQSGSQGLQLTASASFPWNITLSHDFGSDLSGAVAVYLQVPQCCGFSAALSLFAGNGDWVNLERVNNGATGARISVAGQQSVNPVSFSGNPWQLLEIGADSSGVIARLNGATVLIDPRITNLRSVELTLWGGPTGTAYFDDFAVTETPEPGTAPLIGAAVACVMARLRRRNPA